MKRFVGVVFVALCLVFAGGMVLADMGKTATPLKVAAGSKAESHNNEGIEHYNQGHWDVAKKHFMGAAEADPNSAEAHYNLALVLDKSGDHKDATQHFQKAYDLGKGNPDIANSAILKAHLKMK
jgi:Flp pilus assembly protein TadD